ncbi:protein-L-isoaspartate(D-aspartate) O-methyltransferase [Candidatus Macondimonas diazotrophica]|jgi:protein-L-isoaspartate(D-aspartate) O-methyltransferase|uniref:Protein-L-isoaspartate O-methyltransferase n=1 Tax=Candidatus Macondimonas diazotrophica TaxID=2305248 RepID=A0A4Z0F7W0_9GAMM|nr:protein-L-isoaspartate(D-aspartate) O-methyltransferase [Candidatus Macondimonas diazotrophica]MDY6956699.1 protein-L-isoaspartate(D-aspartate) O-methyltransferase [Pseudomonadota bacterium]HBG29329.1 protein-L-isoaspartate(D-aspartate) O-methyltransferase [Gammaproteobacteria bacterium]NCU00139.1 protein-L-isoaspartate(D-aspartate) O-methyltransferase [Candidatus Macondimonas diazotrophica]TFZ81796.1 protein-L-isoaspartate(D-aspartate) O-methyltransferase [Candidatus Macondimonas diazotroph
MSEAVLRGSGMTSLRTRKRMVERLVARGIRDERVLDLMARMPRHLFVEEALASRAYEDLALPIGFGQTISQPYMVARMTEALLQNGPLERVLEVGTGSGFQTALLASLVPQVYSVERIAPLLEQARRRLTRMRIANVRFHHSDGHWGWPEHAPFDAILVAAAPNEIPESLLMQLRIEGALVIPVGSGVNQRLMRYTRTPFGFADETLETVHFVPLQEGVG